MADVTPIYKVRLAGAVIACLLAPIGFLLVGAAVFALSGSDSAAELCGVGFGIPLGAAGGWLAGQYLTPRLPRLIFALFGLALGAVAGALPGYALSWMASRSRRPHPEVFALTETDLIAMVLFFVGVPLAAFIGAILGFRFGSR